MFLSLIVFIQVNIFIGFINNFSALIRLFSRYFTDIFGHIFFGIFLLVSLTIFLILSDYFRDILLIFLAIFFSEVLFRDLFPLTCHTNVF